MRIAIIGAGDAGKALGSGSMTRRTAHRLAPIAAVVIAAFALAAGAGTARADCPPPPADHIPQPPAPPLNIDTVKALLLDYHQRYYDQDVAAVFRSAQDFVEQNAARWPRPALVLDIDETSLTNWPSILADNFGYIPNGGCDALPDGPCGFNDWVQKSQAKAIGPALALFKAAKAKGVAVIFITGRRDKQRDATLLNLDHAGFDGWTELRTRPDRDNFKTAQAFKADERAKVEAEPEDYTIIANVGDQQSDITGAPAGKCTFKVPNPFYFIP
jgi:HAD superfamily, subfamily IIIB (Acid phosphatase)